MIKRRLTAVVLILMLTGCSLMGEPPEEVVSPSPSPLTSTSPPTIQWAEGKKPHSGMFGIAWNPEDTLSPLLTSNRVNREMYNLLYDSLFTLDETFTPQESLCKSIYTADNQTFVLTLRENVLFHNGETLTARDVVSSFQTARLPASPYASRFSQVESVSVSGERVEVVLKAPNERFAALLTFPVLSAGDKASPPSGTGPYTMTREDERAYLTPFADWWRKKPLPVGHIELNAVDKLEDMSYLMSVGDISLVTTDINNSYGIGFNGDFDVWEYPTPTMYYIGFNSSHPILGDARARLALSFAFDRDSLVSKVFQNAADSATLAISPVLRESGGGYDLVRYTELVTDAGLEDTDNDGILDIRQGRVRMPFELRLIADEEDPAACETARFIAESLENLGVAVTVETLPKTQLAADIENGAYGLYCARVTLTADFPQSRSQRAATETSLSGQLETYLDKTPIAPLLFKRERALTHWSEVTGIKPVFGNPYVNIYEWTVSQ